ncbi:MAG: TlpA family protein disulfide reductase [Deltaproteobacteria bacterium]|nr:TlpA family protein disulfide reductase [Deltaproteobacteria bacterium]
MSVTYLRENVSRIITVVLIACCFTLPGVAAANSKQLDITKLTNEIKAPDFVLTDLKGQQFRLSDRKGKNPVLIVFSATWCTYCVKEIPNLKSLHAAYAKQGLEIVNIDIQESKEKVDKFAAKHDLPYRTLLDLDGAVSGVYQVRGIPTTVLIDKNGLIVCRQCRNLEAMIKSIMKK